MSHSHQEPEYLIPFTTDFGFKRAFADEADTTFARKAIQVLTGLPRPIEHLTYLRNDLQVLSKLGRGSISDVICRDEHHDIFITEMQDRWVEHLFERLFFYVYQVYSLTVRKGDFEAV